MRRCHLRNMRTAAIHPSDKKGEAFPFDGSVSLFAFLFFDYFNLQIIKIDLFNKAVFGESCFGVAFKVIDVG